jgi:hypothetical protein
MKALQRRWWLGSSVSLVRRCISTWEVEAAAGAQRVSYPHLPKPLIFQQCSPTTVVGHPICTGCGAQWAEDLI